MDKYLLVCVILGILLVGYYYKDSLFGKTISHVTIEKKLIKKHKKNEIPLEDNDTQSDTSASSVSHSISYASSLSGDLLSSQSERSDGSVSLGSCTFASNQSGVPSMSSMSDSSDDE